jgi:hypothetical protein
MAVKNKEQVVIKLSYDEKPLPMFEEKPVTGKEWIFFGKDNLYPDYLLGLYENSSYHNSIVNGKADYIKGGGFTVEAKELSTEQVAKIQQFIDNPNPNDSLNDILEKIALDLELYGGFSLEVIWEKAGGRIAEIYYIDIHNLRLSADKKSVFFSKDWSSHTQSKEKTGLEKIPLFDERKPSGKSIFYYCEPRKAARLYPKPNYIGGIKAINTDMEITNFHYNSIQNGFTGGSLINFANGTPPAEERKEIEKKIKLKHSGTDNANSIVITFSDGKDKAPTVLSLNGNDLDKRFDILDKSTQQKIFTCHKVTSPILFGIKTEGQLGGRTEMATAFELMQNGYIASKQKRIEDVFNYLFSINKFEGNVTIIQTEFLNFELSEAELVKVMTRDELRDRIGLEKLTTTSNPISDALNTLSPLVATQVLATMTRDEIRSLGGLPPEKLPAVTPTLSLAEMKAESEYFKNYGQTKDKYVTLRQRNIFFNSHKECVLSEIKLIQTKFAVDVDSAQQKVLDVIDGSGKTTPESIAQATGQDIEAVKRIIKVLEQEGIISGSYDTGYDVTEEIEEPTGIQVMYSYEERQDVPDAKESRDFCIEMMKLNKFYTRRDIEEISVLLGRDIWATRGGYYHNPETGVDTPYCRHIWRQHVVRKK